MIDKHNLTFFSKKKVLITGHTGFKGSWLTKILTQNNATVLGYSLEAAKNSHFTMLNMDQEIESVYGDIRDKEKLSSVISEFAPEIVFHLAAQPLVRLSYQDPVATMETNIMGSVNLLDAVRTTESIRSLVFVTSDKCYENLDWVWGYRENDRLGGRDPYSASKGAAEIVYSSYQRSFFESLRVIGTASVRAGNVIGGGDWALDRLIPDCIRALESGKPLEIRNPSATRPWQHVLEPLSGYLLLAKCLYEDHKKFSGAWNFGPKPDQVRTVIEVAEKIFKEIGRGTVAVTGNSSAMHEANLLQLNCEKAHQILGWYPKWSVEKTLVETANWYQKFLKKNNIIKETERQIEEYFATTN